MLWLIAALSTFSTMHLLAHSAWAQAAMIAGGVQLAVVRGKLSHPGLVARHRSRPGADGRLVPDPRAERLALLAVGLPAPRDRLVVPRRCAVPARSGGSAATTGVDCGLRPHLRGDGGAAVRRSRRCADLRPSVRHPGSDRAVRVAGAALACLALALALPGAARRMRRSTGRRRPAVARSTRRRRRSGSSSRRRDLVARSLEVLAADGSLVSGPPTLSATVA